MIHIWLEIHTYLLTPYKDYGNLTPAKKYYNYKLSALRVCIEQAFGLLKGKFQILQCINGRDMTQIKFIIMACVVLHNFIIKNSSPIKQPFVVSNENPTPAVSLANEDPPRNFQEDVDGKNKEYGEIKVIKFFYVICYVN